MDAQDILNENVDLIDNEMKEIFRGRDYPSQLYQMMKYHLGWLDEEMKPVEQYKGKRFRPTLTLLTYNSLSGVYDKVFPAAVAIELIHNFSLIHDDIEDRDEERRHKPTVWKLWGVPHGINAGDGMHVLANIAALGLRERLVTESKIVDVLFILNNTIMRLCEGQYLDMSFESSMDVTVEEYIRMISGKTAALVEASMEVGAILATNDDSIVEKFREFGYKIGLAFQIVDDIIGIWGENTGKPFASDIRNKKKTLPVIYTLENAVKEDGEFLRGVYSKEVLDDKDVQGVLSIMEKMGAKKHSEEIAKKYENEALYALDQTGIKNQAISKIMVLAEFLVRRKY